MWDTKIDKTIPQLFYGHLASTSPDLLAKLIGIWKAFVEWLLLISANITLDIQTPIEEVFEPPNIS